MNKISLVGVILPIVAALIANAVYGNGDTTQSGKRAIAIKREKDALIKKLEALSTTEEPIKIVSTLLTARDKALIELDTGVTVANLVELDYFNDYKCYAGLDAHFRVCERLLKMHRTPVTKSLEIYCKHMRETIEEKYDCDKIKASKSYRTRVEQLLGLNSVGACAVYGYFKRMPLFSLEKREELSKDDLIKGLNAAKKPEEVAEVLFKAKHKDTTKVFKDVTVGELIAISEFHMVDCGKPALKRLSKFCDRFPSGHLSSLRSLSKWCSYVHNEVQELCYDLGMGLLMDDVKTAEASETKKPTKVFSCPAQEELSRVQLLDELKRAGRDPELVAAALLRTKDKDTTEVAEGVTVTNVVAFNSMTELSCKKRIYVGVCDKLEKYAEKSVWKSLREYCEHIKEQLDLFCIGPLMRPVFNVNDEQAIN